MKTSLVRLIPDFIQPALRKIYYFPLDLVDQLKTRDTMVPPRSMIFIGSGDFEKIGEEFKYYFTELGHLNPTDRVLDVGCGIGRMAIPLTSYLSPSGGYWGFDIVKSGITWCQKHISKKFSHFHFLHSDIYSQMYNPRGKLHADRYRFPFENNFFDFVFLTSVFTHMLPADLENYLGEISRVLKPGGRCFITFFILNAESLSLIRSGRSKIKFQYKIEGCLSDNHKVPETALAYEESILLQLFKKYYLTVVQPIHYGFWCQRENFLTFQDVVITQKNISS